MAIDYESELLKRDQQIADLIGQVQKQDEEIKRLKALLSGKGVSKGSKKPKFNLNYSARSNRPKSKRGKQATGRCPQSEKISQVSLSKAIYPKVEPQNCVAQRQQYAWRIIDGQAQYVCYSIYAEADSPVLPGVPGLRNSRSEYGLEIILMVAYLHYWIGLWHFQA
jgi:transposase